MMFHLENKMVTHIEARFCPALDHWTMCRLWDVSLLGAVALQSGVAKVSSAKGGRLTLNGGKLPRKQRLENGTHPGSVGSQP